MNSRVARLVGTTFVVLAIVGCAGPQSSPPPATSAAPASASSAASTSGTLCAKAFVPCPLPAGTYSSAPFEHPFKFTIIGDDWTNDRAWPHGGAATRGGSNAFFWASGVESGVIDRVTTPIGPTPADFIAHLRKFAGFTVSEPVPVTIDGVSGSQVDVLTNDIAAEKMYLIPEDAFNVSPGEKLRFIVLDMDGETVILFLDSFKAPDFDAFLAEVGQPILDGLTWE